MSDKIKQRIDRFAEYVWQDLYVRQQIEKTWNPIKLIKLIIEKSRLRKKYYKDLENLKL